MKTSEKHFGLAVGP